MTMMMMVIRVAMHDANYEHSEKTHRDEGYANSQHNDEYAQADEDADDRIDSLHSIRATGS